VSIRNTILQLRARTTKIWTAVAERSGDTAFRTAGCFQKRRGASLPAAVQKIVVAAKGRVKFIRGQNSASRLGTNLRHLRQPPSSIFDFPSLRIRPPVFTRLRRGKQAERYNAS
jgi:hypothetical protein